MPVCVIIIYHLAVMENENKKRNYNTCYNFVFYDECVDIYLYTDRMKIVDNIGHSHYTEKGRPINHYY